MGAVFPKIIKTSKLALRKRIPVPEIIIYSRATCAPCQIVKKYLTSRQLKYTERNIDHSETWAREAYSKAGMSIVPVLEIGDQIITGMNIGLINSTIDKLAQA